MKKTAAHPTSLDHADSMSASAQRTLRPGVDWLSTTWRIAVPVCLFAGAGIYMDKRLSTAPWLTLAGLVTGFGLAAGLVSRLLGQAEREDNP